MDYQWFQNTIFIDIIKMSFLYIVSRNIYYYHLSPWYILRCGYATTLIIQKNLISLHINAIWPEEKGFKISAWLFCFFTVMVDMLVNEHPLVWWFHFTFKLRFFTSNGISFPWLRTLSRILLTLQYRNE